MKECWKDILQKYLKLVVNRNPIFEHFLGLCYLHNNEINKALDCFIISSNVIESDDNHKIVFTKAQELYVQNSVSKFSYYYYLVNY